MLQIHFYITVNVVCLMIFKDSLYTRDIRLFFLCATNIFFLVGYHFLVLQCFLSEQNLYFYISKFCSLPGCVPYYLLLSICLFFFFRIFLLCIGVQLINNFVIVSVEQQRDSVIHVSRQHAALSLLSDPWFSTSACVFTVLHEMGKFFFYLGFFLKITMNAVKKDKISLEKAQHFKTMFYPLLSYNQILCFPLVFTEFRRLTF